MPRRGLGPVPAWKTPLGRYAQRARGSLPRNWGCTAWRRLTSDRILRREAAAQATALWLDHRCSEERASRSERPHPESEHEHASHALPLPSQRVPGRLCSKNQSHSPRRDCYIRPDMRGYLRSRPRPRPCGPRTGVVPRGSHLRSDSEATAAQTALWRSSLVAAFDRGGMSQRAEIPLKSAATEPLLGGRSDDLKPRQSLRRPGASRLDSGARSPCLADNRTARTARGTQLAPFQGCAGPGRWHNQRAITGYPPGGAMRGVGVRCGSE